MTLLQSAVDAAASFTPWNSESQFEQYAWQQILSSRGTEALFRESVPGHFTASGVVLSPDGEQTCLVLHHKLGKWLQPGGHLEPQDVSVQAAAEREIREETGIVAQVLPEPALLSRHAAPCNPSVVLWHWDFQFVAICEPGEVQTSDESPDVRWFNHEQFAAMDAAGEVIPGMAEHIERARAFIRSRG